MLSRAVEILTQIWKLPLSLKGIILVFFIKRLFRRKLFPHEIMWASFLYEMRKQPVVVTEQRDYYEMNFCYNNNSLKVFMRKGRSSDICVFMQVFIRNDYLPFFQEALIRKDLFTCLDAGANIGFFSIACATWLPDITFVAIEPDEENYRLLCKNIYANKLENRVKPVYAALWSSTKNLHLTKDGLLEWSYTVSENLEGGPICRGITLTEVIRHTGGMKFDLIKMDIEGAEHQLFNNEAFRLAAQKAKIIGLEIHGDAGIITDFLKQMKYRISRHNELTLAVSD